MFVIESTSAHCSALQRRFLTPREHNGSLADVQDLDAAVRMGSASSKFKKYLQNGDEFAAMQIYQNSPELRKNLDPNLSYGDHHHHNTALHYAAKHGNTYKTI